MRTFDIPAARRTMSCGLVLALAACVSTPKPAAPPPVAAPPPALPAAPPQQDWRDVPLTPGDWSWRMLPDQGSLAQYGSAGQPAVFALRCDPASRTILFSLGGRLPAGAGGMTLTTSFGAFPLAATDGGGEPPAIVARIPARDPRLDQLAFSRGRFLVDAPGQSRLVLPSWPEIARVIEDCRG